MGEKGIGGQNRRLLRELRRLDPEPVPAGKNCTTKGAVRLRILTIQAKLKGFAPEGFQRDRGLPIASRDEGRRSVGIAKEQLAVTIAIPGPIGKPFDGVEIAEPRAGAVWLFYRGRNSVV